MSLAAKRWSELVADAAVSGMSMQAFARSRGINARTLAWWKWNLGRTRQTSPFVEVVVAAAPALVIEVGGVRLIVDGQTDLGLLHRVVKVLS